MSKIIRSPEQQDYEAQVDLLDAIHAGHARAVLISGLGQRLIQLAEEKVRDARRRDDGPTRELQEATATILIDPATRAKFYRPNTVTAGHVSFTGLMFCPPEPVETFSGFRLTHVGYRVGKQEDDRHFVGGQFQPEDYWLAQSCVQGLREAHDSGFLPNLTADYLMINHLPTLGPGLGPELGDSQS